MTYQPKSSSGNRLGLYADQIEARREAAGLDENGFRLDGTDPAKGLKEAMVREKYRQADAHLWFKDLLPRAPTAANAAPTDSEIE